MFHAFPGLAICVYVYVHMRVCMKKNIYKHTNIHNVSLSLSLCVYMKLYVNPYSYSCTHGLMYVLVHVHACMVIQPQQSGGSEIRVGIDSINSILQNIPQTDLRTIVAQAKV